MSVDERVEMGGAERGSREADERESSLGSNPQAKPNQDAQVSLRSEAKTEAQRADSLVVETESQFRRDSIRFVQ